MPGYSLPVALALLAALAACSPPAADPAPTPTPPPAPTHTPQPTATPAPPEAAHGLYADYALSFDPASGAWAAQSPAGDAAARWNPEENAWEYDFDVIGGDERITVFDAATFPEKFRDIATNWLTASDADWALYQEFVEASRAHFFEREGITQEVSSMTGINENLRSLWGMIYWAQNNKERVIAEQLMPVVTPQELRMILEDEPLFQSWGEKQETDKGSRAFLYGHRGLTIGGIGGPYSYDSDNYGPILGREDFRTPRSPLGGIDGGDLALLARLFPDDPTTLVTIVSMKTPPDGGFTQTHALYAQALVLEENYTLPAGTTCYAARAGEIYNSRPLPVDYHVQPLGSVAEWMDRLGFNLYFGHGDLNVDRAGLNAIACLHPQSGLEVVTWFSNYTINTGRTSVIWPWQQ